MSLRYRVDARIIIGVLLVVSAIGWLASAETLAEQLAEQRRIVIAHEVEIARLKAYTDDLKAARLRETAAANAQALADLRNIGNAIIGLMVSLNGLVIAGGIYVVRIGIRFRSVPARLQHVEHVMSHLQCRQVVAVAEDCKGTDSL